jgi:GAF domain-containing protein/nitrogen-specific signal transduction histidine kinase
MPIETNRDVMETRKYSSEIEEPALIERLARVVSSVRAAKPDYTRLAEELEQAIPFDIFGIVLLRHDNIAVRVVTCYRDAGCWKAASHQHPFDGSKLQQIRQTSEPEVIVNDYPDGLDGLPLEHGDALSQYHYLRSTMLVPLVVEGHVLGTLELGSSVAHTYADHTLQRLVNAVAHVLAAAIEGAQSGGSAEIQNRQRKALQVVSSSLASKMDLPTILNQIVNGIAQSLNVASAIFTYDRRKDMLVLVAQAGLDDAILKQQIGDGILLTDTCIVGQTVIRRQPHVSRDISVDQRFPTCIPLFKLLSIRSIFSHPLFVDDTVYGALLLCSAEAGGFTPLKIDILSLFASQATIAIRNGISLESAYRRQRFLSILDEIGNQESQGEQAELEMLRTVRQATEQKFNISFLDLLRFISEYLLVRNDLDVQDILYTPQDEQKLDLLEPLVDQSSALTFNKAVLQIHERNDSYAETLTALTQTAESALVQAGRLGEIGRLIEQLKQSADCVNDAWFIIDTQGVCTYMNPAADAFRNMRLDEMEVSSGSRSLDLSQGLQIEQSMMQVFGMLQTQIRNIDEVREFFLSFTQDLPYQQKVRCILMVEAQPTPLQRGYTSSSSAIAPSDRHYRFTRFPLFNTKGQLEFNALQVHDVTQQVRDENNMSTLLSSVSHDLRTPLTTIKAAASGLLQAGVAWSEADRLEMLEDIEREADQLTILVNALVDLSRIKMGALILEKEWCDILEVMYGALDKLERITSGHEVSIEVPVKPPLILIDHVQVERVFSNLVENAVRRSPANAAVRVTLEAIDDEGEMLRVRVFDQGEAIPEQEHERIFQSYNGLRSYGNGLGLAICKGILEAHQGRIWIESVSTDSTAKTGACFVFTLPMYLRPTVADVEKSLLLPGGKSE